MAVIVSAVLYHHYSFLALLLLIGIGGLIEFYNIVFGGRLGLPQWIFILAGCLLILSGSNVVKFSFNILMMFAMSLLFALGAIMTLLSKQRSWKQIVFLMGGILYIALPLALFYSSSFFPVRHACQSMYRPYWALNIFVLIWSSDTFAYLTGRAFGRRKLFESISPKKTWEGFIGGAVLTIAISFLLSYLWEIPYVSNIAVALCTVVFGTLGDLVESMLKREYNIKDSGNILPGHGGVLDRFDALLISLPFTTSCYTFMWYCYYGY